MQCPWLYEDLGVEFPFREITENEQKVLVYTGNTKTPFDNMPKRTIEFPSAVDVLGLKKRVKVVQRGGGISERESDVTRKSFK